MKKILAIILCLTALLSLTACGKDKEERPNIPAATEPATEAPVMESEPVEEPTEEDWAAIREYGSILRKLDNLEKNGIENHESGEKQEVLREYYEKLLELETVDQWVGTEWGDEENLDRNRKDVLADFTVLEDVLLKEETVCKDALDNDQMHLLDVMSYDPMGRLACTTGSCLSPYNSEPWVTRSFREQIVTDAALYGSDYGKMVYNAEGLLEKIEYGVGEIDLRRTFVYEAGILTGEKLVNRFDSEGTVTYTYNDRGLVAQVVYDGELSGHDKHCFIYEYDEQGRVLSEEFTVYNWYSYDDQFRQRKERVLTEYTYGQDGRLVSGKSTKFDKWLNKDAAAITQWEYRYDEQGRIVEVNADCGDLLNVNNAERCNKAQFAALQAKMQYGDFYIYNPAVKE